MFQPSKFGKYYLYERIAVGGMAEIYKAKMYGVDGFEKNMVVKQILPQYAKHKEFIQMFIDEAKICVTLSHGNIVPVYELGQIDGIYFISMEHVDGKNLGELLDWLARAARDDEAPTLADALRRLSLPTFTLCFPAPGKKLNFERPTRTNR